MRGDAFFVEVAKRPPFTKLHPRIASFFKEYLSKEKVVRFDDRFVVNTQFPPYPSKAFDNLVEGFDLFGDAGQRRVYSVTLAITNRCRYNCWHCYNAGRSQTDLPFETWKGLAAELQEMGAVMVTLMGGEPLLREDLEDIVGLFDERACLILGTTGTGLTTDRATRLRDKGLFGVGVSLDSICEQEHDRLRGNTGAFRTALDALRIARDTGLYPYVVSVATRELLRSDRFTAFLRFAREVGALEVHLLEPSTTGKLAGRNDVLLEKPERDLILEYQGRVAEDEDLPILSAYAYVESPGAFGCGAGLTHLYIDGSGEVCPCQLVPASFGNVCDQTLGNILERMARHLRKPRASCIGRLLAPKLQQDGAAPVPPDTSDEICGRWLPREHPLPSFFQTCLEARDEIDQQDLRAAYDRVRDDYDEFWLAEAARPIDDLLARIRLRSTERVFEAGCGTGFATAGLAERAKSVLAVDLSPGMLARARQRVRTSGADNVQFVVGDAVDSLRALGKFDLVFSSWVLGYIPLRPFFVAASSHLRSGGQLAFVVHKEHSPQEPLEIFAELVARDPSVLQKRVAFDFPRDAAHARSELTAAGLRVGVLWEGSVVFRYATPAQVLEHLLKSGAGTAFYDALDPGRRDGLESEFLRRLTSRHPGAGCYEVIHEYVAGAARKP